MDDSITIPREAAEALIQLASQVLDTTHSTGPENLERGEVTLKNNVRKNLKEAVYQAEKALYEADAKPLTSAEMSANAVRRHHTEDDYSQSKEKWIAR
tara:strand:+ start:621 stop:914 length:294 start_codon:yes stop_codon:yes gene_type:complete